MTQQKIYGYDFEVYSKQKPAWWCVTFIEDVDRGNKITIVNDVSELKSFYENNKNAIFIGYNSRSYDQWIFKALLLQLDVGMVNDGLISNQAGFKLVPKYKKVQLYNYDTMVKDRSLKELEGFGGYKIKETSVPFDKEEPLTETEIAEIVEYNIYDVVALWNVIDCVRGDFDAQLEVIKMFNLDMSLINTTKAQIASYVLGAVPQHTLNDEFEITIPDKLNMPINYDYIVDWFKQDINKSYKTPFKTMENNGSRKLLTSIGGCKAVFGYGGVHASKDNQIFEGIFIIMDVASLYPALMINEGYVSRKLKNPKSFRDLRDRRLILKKAKDPKQKPLKIVINSAYGVLKDRNNACYDPLMSNNVCIAGQLYLTELSARLENVCEIMQINTDGIYVKVENEKDIEIVFDIAKAWESRTGLELEYDVYKKGKLIQKDVNNYILLDMETKKYKSKGAYVKSLSPIDNDLPIINKALIDYFVSDIPVEDTVNNCNELQSFQKIIKLSSKYKQVVHNGEPLKEKVHRVFASKRTEDNGIFKVKNVKGELKYEKIANTPDNCFIDNDDVRDKVIPDYLDKQYYIDLANERIRQFLEVEEVKVDNVPKLLHKSLLTSNNYVEFLNSCSEKGITRKQLEQYVNSNCCEKYGNLNKLNDFYDYHKMFYNKDKITVTTLRNKIKKGLPQNLDIESLILKYSELNKTGKSYINLKSNELLLEIFNTLSDRVINPVEVLKTQQSVLGELRYVDKSYSKDVFVVINWRDAIKPTVILYHLRSGKTVYVHIDENSFDILPLQDGDMIETTKVEKRNPYRIVDKDENGINVWDIDNEKTYTCIVNYNLLYRDYSNKKGMLISEMNYDD